jgi:hypothetical protein
MAKKMKFESFKYRFLIASKNYSYTHQNQSAISWMDFINSLVFEYQDGEVVIAWNNPAPGALTFKIDEARFYLRGDTEKYSERQREIGLLDAEDPIKLKNDKFFDEIVQRVVDSAGYVKSGTTKSKHDLRIDNERQFHDEWANSAQANIVFNQCWGQRLHKAQHCMFGEAIYGVGLNGEEPRHRCGDHDVASIAVSLR